MKSKNLLRQRKIASILYQALAEPIGLVLSSSNLEKARDALYRAKYAQGDPALADLQVRVWPYEEGNLVIVNRKVRIARQAEKVEE